jgi:hypothetical protein
MERTFVITAMVAGRITVAWNPDVVVGGTLGMT